MFKELNKLHSVKFIEETKQITMNYLDLTTPKGKQH